MRLRRLLLKALQLKIGHDRRRHRPMGPRGEKRSRPISRVLSWTAIHLGCASPRTSSDLPGDTRGPRVAAWYGDLPPYLVLLRVGFTVPRRVTTRAVRSYRTFSPLPAPAALWRYVFCGTFRGLMPPRRYLAPCPPEPGLSSVTRTVHGGCLADSRRNYTGLYPSAPDILIARP